METTRPSLLQRVKHRDDQVAWREFYDLYAPLLQRYSRMRGLDTDSASDVTQECMEKLARKMQDFDYARDKGSFKNYLFTLVTNEINSRLRRKRPHLAGSTELARIPSPREDDSGDWDRHWLQQHLAYCLKKVETEFSEATINAFKLYALKQWTIEKVCEALQLTPNQVYLAKSRVTRRLRSEMTTVIGDVL